MISLKPMGFELASGRSFSRDFPSDASTAFIINEAAVKDIGWTNESAIGKSFGSSEINDWEQGQWVDRNGTVIGVLKDFHFESLKGGNCANSIFLLLLIWPGTMWSGLVRKAPIRAFSS